MLVDILLSTPYTDIHKYFPLNGSFTLKVDLFIVDVRFDQFR